MKNLKLMETLTEKAECLVEGIAISIREVKYGKGTGLFETDDDMVGVLKYIQDENDDLELDIWNAYMRARTYKDEPSLKALREATLKSIMRHIDFLANIEKALDSVTIRELLQEIKERSDDNGKESNDRCEEV